MIKIGILEYGMGNLRSVQKAFCRMGISCEICCKPEDAEDFDKYILPGVGHFTEGMRNLKRKGWVEFLKKHVINLRKPILGICLGMQLMTNLSEEGDSLGLAFIDAETRKMKQRIPNIKIPHMGWNQVIITQNDNALFHNIPNGSMFYFVHSYAVVCRDEADILSTTQYGHNEFVSSFSRGNILGVQFHPEKSHKLGLELLSNFCDY